ncbi:MAG: CoA-transferase [Promethearchaeati archaeon SRVP18_Atabeyarchaeia-1]
MEKRITELTSVIEENVKDGDLLIFGGMKVNRVPIACVHEIIRQKKKNLSVMGLPNPLPTDMLCGAGSLKRVEFCYMGIQGDKGFAQMRNFRRAAEQGVADAMEEIGWITIQQILAGALQIPFIPVRGLAGTGILEVRKDFKSIENPFGEEKLIAVPAANPDVAILHVQLADEYGNARLLDPGFAEAEKLIALAAKKVIVTAEEIVPHEKLRGTVTLPYFMVDALAHVSYGAYPSACYKYYGVDWEHMNTYLESNASPESFANYLGTYVYGTKDHQEFIERAGGKKVIGKLKW